MPSDTVADALVVFTPSGKRGSFPLGTPVLTAARKLGVDLDTVCGGRGICGRCQVMLSIGEFPKHGVRVTATAISEQNAVEDRYAAKRGLASGRRLGCQATIQGDMVIDVPPDSQTHKQIVRKRAEVRDIELRPSLRRYFVTVEAPDMHHPSGDLERLMRALQDQHGLRNIEVDLEVLCNLQTTLRRGEWSVTAVMHDDGRGAQSLLHVAPMYLQSPLFGVAVDLGSTTIAAHLVNLDTGEVCASSGIMNPQIRFGEDLMSRVSYAMMNADGAQDMTDAVREGMNELLVALATQADIATDQIMDCVIVCNPVMHHLFLGIDPFELGQAPFALATSGALRLMARDVGLSVHRSGRVYILPCIAGHVGADAAAVALSETPDLSEELTLVIDVGTNAEILLGNRKRVLACSSPTGPAFEGAQISSGQRAAAGAIERVEISPETKEPRCKVIGCDLWSDEEGFAQATATSGVTGICGSGIIEAVAEMRMAGIVDASGLIGSAMQVGSERCLPDGRTHSYLLYDGSSHGGPVITVTNADVRAIQMAKAALYAGARLLMDKLGVDAVDRIVLAGAFGAHISAKHAMVLGMIPDAPLHKVTTAGNAAGTGARIALLDHSKRLEIEATVRKIEKIETAVEARFQEHFVNATAIPNAAETFETLRTFVVLPDVNHKSVQDVAARTRGGGRSARSRRSVRPKPAPR